MAVATKGNVTTKNQTPSANFYQFAHNQNTGNNRLVVFFLTMANTVSPSTATYNGVSMTRLYTLNRSGLGQRMAFYYLVDPPTGSNTLRVNFSGSQFNPISAYVRSFTNSGGIGNSIQSGGSASPNTKTLTVEDDSFIMMTSCCVNAIATQQIPTGANKSFTTYNTNRQVSAGAITDNSGHSSGSISIRATSVFGNLSLDRVEIKGLGATPPSGESGNFFLVM